MSTDANGWEVWQSARDHGREILAWLVCSNCMQPWPGGPVCAGEKP